MKPMSLLLVEDEVDLRELLVDSLEAEGMVVTTVDNGTDAIEKLRSGQHFDAVVSDVAMPGPLNGIDVAREAVALSPALRVILASGHALAQLPVLPPNVRYMAKPYRVRQLIQLLEGAP